MVRRLLAVQGPIQFIAGYLAMAWFAQATRSGQASETVLLMYDFLMPADMEPEFVNVIGQLAKPFPWHSTVFLDADAMAEIVKGSHPRRYQKLYKALGFDTFDEIIIGRDFCGEGNPLILNAYPQAKRIVYGDAMGIVGNEGVTDGFDWRSPLRSLAYLGRDLALRAWHGQYSKMKFDAAVLTLPIDWSGSYLDTIPLLVPPREFVVEQITAMADSIQALHDYAARLINSEEDNHLVLLSNLSASGLLSPKNEVALYVDIVTTTVPKGATVLLKPHPRGARDVLNEVVGILGEDYKVIAIDDQAFSGFPIELWACFIRHCNKIVPVYSASAYQIKYIYGKDVILTLDEARISRYMYADKAGLIAKGNRSITDAVARVGTWDGRSPLWKGC